MSKYQKQHVKMLCVSVMKDKSQQWYQAKSCESCETASQSSRFHTREQDGPDKKNRIYY